MIFVADGGANRLYNIDINNNNKIIPHSIIGDMDSI